MTFDPRMKFVATFRHRIMMPPDRRLSLTLETGPCGQKSFHLLLEDLINDLAPRTRGYLDGLNDFNEYKKTRRQPQEIFKAQASHHKLCPPPPTPFYIMKIFHTSFLDGLAALLVPGHLSATNTPCRDKCCNVKGKEAMH
ncbi:hypothetical protein E1B28_005398 [Marasmius oreades]|uniref:Uncharacterized protein n=1 Tax=Marasmius oreades TaxID=181124 RepID=A0A9P7S3R5_9AGAR|nr:uncharacterized protein E1B28_005398 [Marasmius oreades]KAG7094570.1 hypothetical protein E1B28_005398 [Marasmius oreades]